MTMPVESDRDWREDFGHENGRYICHCFKCNAQFYGHKRRIICKLCHTPPMTPTPAPPSDADRAQAVVADLLATFAEGAQPQLNFLHSERLQYLITDLCAAVRAEERERAEAQLKLADKAIDEILMQWSPLFDRDPAGRDAQHVAGNRAAFTYKKVRSAP